MLLGKVVGTLVATRKETTMEGLKSLQSPEETARRRGVSVEDVVS